MPHRPSRATIMPIYVHPCFHQELPALRKLERVTWPDGPVCPHCGARDRIGAVTGKGARPGLKFCCHCRKQFRATIGTIFEGSHVPLHKWFQAVLLLTGIDGGISAHQLHWHLGVTYKTALCMGRRLEPLILAALAELTVMAGTGDPPPLGRRRIRWRRRRVPRPPAAEPVPGAAAAPAEDEDSVPWVYPAPPANLAYRAFGDMAQDLGCIEDEEVFDGVLRRIAIPAPVAAPA
jgi:transposase-like protein